MTVNPKSNTIRVSLLFIACLGCIWVVYLMQSDDETIVRHQKLRDLLDSYYDGKLDGISEIEFISLDVFTSLGISMKDVEDRYPGFKIDDLFMINSEVDNVTASIKGDTLKEEGEYLTLQMHGYSEYIMVLLFKALKLNTENSETAFQFIDYIVFERMRKGFLDINIIKAEKLEGYGLKQDLLKIDYIPASNTADFLTYETALFLIKNCKAKEVVRVKKEGCIRGPSGDGWFINLYESEMDFTENRIIISFNVHQQFYEDPDNIPTDWENALRLDPNPELRAIFMWDEKGQFQFMESMSGFPRQVLEELCQP